MNAEIVNTGMCAVTAGLYVQKKAIYMQKVGFVHVILILVFGEIYNCIILGGNKQL